MLINSFKIAQHLKRVFETIRYYTCIVQNDLCVLKRFRIYGQFNISVKFI